MHVCGFWLRELRTPLTGVKTAVVGGLSSARSIEDGIHVPVVTEPSRQPVVCMNVHTRSAACKRTCRKDLGAHAHRKRRKKERPETKLFSTSILFFSKNHGKIELMNPDIFNITKENVNPISGVV